MPNLPPVVVAALTGFISALLLAIPVGPVNLTIMNEGVRRGFKWALLIGFGATVMEVIYCFIAFTGFASLFGNRIIKASMELFSFAFMLFLGIKFLVAKTAAMPIPIGQTAGKIEARLEEKLHPHSAFMIGFVRVMGNPNVLLGWIFFAAYFISREWVSANWPGKLGCVGGVALGTGLFFFVLSYRASRGYGRISEKTLLRMEHFSGVGLLVLAFINAGHIIWQMAHHKI